LNLFLVLVEQVSILGYNIISLFKEVTMNYESFLELVEKRRSIRRVKPEPIPDEYVDKIIEAARWAPSGANSQPWEFIVVKKQELKESIVRLVEEDYALAHRMELTREPQLRHPVYGKPLDRPLGFAIAPVFILLCGDTRTKDALPLSANLQNSESVFKSSLANAFLYMHLAATTLGLGSQWVSNTALPFVQCQLKELLGIPRELEIYDMMAVGYAAGEPRPRPVRAREEMVHYDYYDKTKFRTDEEVKDFIGTISRARKP